MTEASGADGTGPPIRLLGYSPSRSTYAARTPYEGMRPGELMSDGYEPYAAIAEQHRLVHLGPLPPVLPRSLAGAAQG